MTEKKDDSAKNLWMLGAAITLPMILVSGPIAGFLIGHFVFVKFFGSPQWVVVIFVLLGFVGSGLQSYRLIQEINQADSKQSPDSTKNS